MTLKKMSAILTAYAASFEASGNSAAARQVAELADALKKKGAMDVAMLARLLGSRG